MIKRRDTQESRDYWDFVESAAKWVRAHHLCFSNMCIVTGADHCDSPNTKDRKIAREMAELEY